MTAASDRPWYEEAFRAAYLDVYPHRDLASAREEVHGLVERGLRGRVLDLACGFGRHTLALRELDVEAFGLDLSAELLAHAETLSGAELLRGRLVRADAGALPFAAACFDGVAMLFSSFGYLDDEGNARVLAGVARLLRPGGVLVLDLMNPDRIRAELVPESLTERDGIELQESRRLTEWGRRVVKDVRLSLPDGASRSWREDVRLYGPEELRALAAPCGLRVERVEGDFDGSPFESGLAGESASPRQIVWAVREGPLDILS